MAYNFDNLHWQEFEYLSYRVIRILVSKDVKFIEGGNDKGRDILHTGGSKQFRDDLSGQWNFQVKHKTSQDQKQNVNSLLYDLKVELKKTFVTNKLYFDNYILVSNIKLTGDLIDKLRDVFDLLKSEFKFSCENFDIISYRDFENTFNENENLKWLFPNVINNESFEVLIQRSQTKHIESRTKNWLELVKVHKPKFVYTQFYQRAIQKLGKYPAIILSGPPRSGKTFNAEILALNFAIHRNYQTLLIEDPNDLDKVYNKSIPQFFIFDDVFGKHVLTTRAEEWYNKFDRILSLADDTHKIIFTSREYIFKAFIKIGGKSSEKALKKIIVESHNYSKREKLSLLYRYTILSTLEEHIKDKLLGFEETFISHKNFSPETIRTFFISIHHHSISSVVDALKDHLDEPDDYLKPVFFNLEQSKQAALLAVLCSDTNKENGIHRKFKSICADLSLNTLTNAEIEFEELDDSILKIIGSEVAKEIQFYHPSMQEFLLRLLINDKTNKLKDIVLQNVNTTILDLSYVKSASKSMIAAPKRREITIQNNDLFSIRTGIVRLINSPFFDLRNLRNVFKWINIENHNLDLRLNDPSLQNELKELTTKVIEDLFSEKFYSYHKASSSVHWSNLFADIYYTISKFQITPTSFDSAKLLLLRKSTETFGWKIALYSLYYLGEEEVLKILGSAYFSQFEQDLRNSINRLGYEVYGEDFPDFKTYQSKIRINSSYERIKQKPNNLWYPRFLEVYERIKTLKTLRKFSLVRQILDNQTKAYSELDKMRVYAKNRHNFITNKGWW